MRIAKVVEYGRRWKSTAKEVAGHSVLFAQFLSLLHLTDAYIFSPTLAHGPSMLPTLNLTGDVLLVEKLSPLMGKVGPGDVVLVRSPVNPRRVIMKRVVGMEGDRVTFLVDPGRSDRSQSLVVPKGHVWIQGDNVYSSRDSRSLGPIPYGLVLGKVFYRALQRNENTPNNDLIYEYNFHYWCGHLKTLDPWDNNTTFISIVVTVALRRVLVARCLEPVW